MRPVVHVQDVARAFQAVLEAPIETIRNEAFNLGADHLNHQIRDLGRIVAETVPGCELVLRRSRAAISALTRRISPSSREPSRRSISSGRRVTGRTNLWRVQKIGLTHGEFTDNRFTRLSWLRRLLDRGSLDDSLRWTGATAQLGRARSRASAG